MANAKQCDRCGKYYSKNDLSPLYPRMGVYNENQHSSSNYDLCPDCVKDLENFMCVKNTEEKAKNIIQKMIYCYCKENEGKND